MIYTKTVFLFAAGFYTYGVFVFLLFFWLGLRTVQGRDPKVFERRFRRRFDCFRPFLEECRTAGYAVEEEGRWHLTPKGFLVSNQIIGGMLDARAAEKRRRAEATARGDFRVDLGNPGKA